MRPRALAAIVLAAAAAACAAVGILRGVDESTAALAGISLTYAVGSDSPSMRSRVIEVIRNRLDHERIEHVSIFERGESIQVELADPDAAALQRAQRVLERGGTLEIEIVVEEDETMKTVAADLRDFPLSQGRPGVRADVETWYGPEGDMHSDVFLRVDDDAAADGRAALRAVLGAHANPAPGRPRIGFQHVVPEDGSTPFWRTYVLEGTPVLGGAFIDEVAVTRDAVTDQPVVMVTMTSLAARPFEDFTRQNVGRKLAITLDGEVRSAPVIEASIPGGRVQIRMSPGDVAHQEQEAAELVSVLRAGVLPAPLLLNHERSFDVPPRPFGRIVLPYFIGAGVVAAILVVFLILSRRLAGAP